MPTRYEGAGLEFIRYRGAVASELRVGGDNTIAPDVAIPTVTIQVAFQNNNTEAVLTAVPAGGAGAPYTYEWVNINDRSTIIETAAALTVTADGTYEVVVIDMDDVRSEAECAIVDLNVGPSAVLTGPASRTAGQTTALTITVSDPDHPTTVTWTLTQNGAQITSGTGDTTNMAFSATARSTAGTDMFVLRAEDPDGATAEDIHNVTVTVPAIARSYTATGTGTPTFTGTQRNGFTLNFASRTSNNIPTDAFSSYRLSSTSVVDIFGDANGDGSGALVVQSITTVGGFSQNVTVSGGTLGTVTVSGGGFRQTVTGLGTTTTVGGSISVGGSNFSNDPLNVNLELEGIVATGYTVNGETAGNAVTIVRWQANDLVPVE